MKVTLAHSDIDFNQKRGSFRGHDTRHILARFCEIRLNFSWHIFFFAYMLTMTHPVMCVALKMSSGDVMVLKIIYVTVSDSSTAGPPIETFRLMVGDAIPVPR